jgi:hypothetical protein
MSHRAAPDGERRRRGLRDHRIGGPRRRPAAANRFPKRTTARGLLVLLLVITTAAPAAATDDDGQGWFLFTLQGPLPAGFRLFLEAQPRVGGDGMRQLLLRPAIGYPVTRRWSLWQGYAWTPTFEPFNGEHRSWQQSLLQFPLGPIRVVNRTRLEQRFIDGAGGVSLRARHMLRLVLPLDRRERWSLALYDEPFFTLNETGGGPATGFNQNRAYLGLARRLGENVSVELAYMAQYLRGSGDDLLSHNSVLWLDYSW